MFTVPDPLKVPFERTFSYQTSPLETVSLPAARCHVHIEGRQMQRRGAGPDGRTRTLAANIDERNAVAIRDDCVSRRPGLPSNSAGKSSLVQTWLANVPVVPNVITLSP